MEKIITLLTAAAIVFDIFTPMRLYFVGGKSLMMLIPTVVILLNDGFIKKKNFLPVGLYVLICSILMVSGCKYFNIPGLIAILFAYACFEHYILTRDQHFAKVVLGSLYASLMIMVMISIPLFISMPNLSRLMINAEENGMTSPILFWTIQYSTIHSMPIYVIPILFFLRIRKGKFEKFILFLFAMAILILMFYADATTALLITIGIYVVAFLYKPQKTMKENIVKIGIVSLFLYIFVNKNMLIGVLRTSQFIFEGSSTYNKIDEMVMSLFG